ncbi:MAG: diacylglycerol/polyprenol kinase family protein [Candidatus Zixiibacteriota bacterium]
MSQTTRIKRSAYTSDESLDISFGAELLRKGTHMCALLVPGLYWGLGTSKPAALAILAPIAAFVTLVDISRLRGWRFWNGFDRVTGFVVRQHERAGDFTGAFYILWGFCLTILLFDRNVAILAMSFIVIGDTFAALIGRRFGRTRFRGKSLEGSLACLAGTALVAFGGNVILDFPLWLGLAGALVATIVEAIPDFVDDNLSAPLISGLVMTLLFKILSA